MGRSHTRHYKNRKKKELARRRDRDRKRRAREQAGYGPAREDRDEREAKSARWAVQRSRV